jgi:hypothetical protein
MIRADGGRDVRRDGGAGSGDGMVGMGRVVGIEGWRDRERVMSISCRRSDES